MWCEGEAQVISAKQCGRCHPIQLEAWLTSPHMIAMSSIPFQERRSLRCRTCHDDAGIRVLVKQQFDAHAVKGHSIKQSSQKGVDCLSCHGFQNAQFIAGKHDRDKIKPSNKPSMSCDRCHSLPPLKSNVNLCYDPHSLRKKERYKCLQFNQTNTVHIQSPLGGQEDHTLKNSASQGSKSRIFP
jgi:hypothetical protein